jgi:hypothetical protein
MVSRLRPGHSLPELIVAVTFLAGTAVAVGGMAVLGGRWTALSVARQEAIRLAGSVLDSVTAAPAAVAGEREIDGLRVRWSADEDGGIRVVVTPGGDAAPLAVLSGHPRPAAPVLPDER